jgi:long-subunit fatty acid transport protein
MSLACIPHSALGDWNTAVRAQYRYDDNVGDAQSSDDIVGDTIVSAAASVYQLYPLGDHYSVTVAGNLGAESYHRIDGLSNAYVGGAVSLRRRWGLGAYAPWARLEVQETRSDYRDDYRNGWLDRASLAVGKRIDERWNIHGEYAWERRTAATQPQEVAGISGDAFSQSSRSLSAGVEFSWSENTYLTFGVAGRHGDVVSTTLDHYDQLAASRAIAADPAFGPIAYAYKLTATTWGFNGGVKFAPILHGMIGLEYQRLDAHADGGNEYIKSVLALTGSYGF